MSISFPDSTSVPFAAESRGNEASDHERISFRFGFAWAVVSLVLLATYFAYRPALNGAMLWDDNGHITRSDLRSLEGLRKIWIDPTATQQYYPLLHTAFWCEWQLWGDSMAGYHRVTLLWHSIATILLFAVLRKLVIPGALLAATIFALHPVMVESVAWISEQKNTLSAVFYLAAMLAYLNFTDSRSRRWYWLAFVLFVMGLLTKTVTATLPAALLVIFWWQRGTLSWRRDVRPLVPWFVLAAVAGVTTAWIERNYIGAKGPEFQLSLIERALLAGRVIWFYIAKLLWPTDLSFIYPRWHIDTSSLGQWMFPIAAVAVTVALWAVRRRSRAPLAAWLFFVGTLFPVLGFLNVYPFIYSYVADHFQYLASLGVIVPFAAAVGTFFERGRTTVRCLAALGSVAIVPALGFHTWQQTQIYSHPITLYRATLALNPNCWMAENNLGIALLATGDRKGAVAHYEAALHLKPDYFEAHSNLGFIQAEAGQLADALAHHAEAVRLAPTFAPGHLNYGNALLSAGRAEEALAEFEIARNLRPGDPVVESSTGIALSQLGRFTEAIVHLQEAVRLKPDYVDAHSNLGIALSKVGENDGAIQQLNLALKFDPNNLNAHRNLGYIYTFMGKTSDAIAHFRAALLQQPNQADLLCNLGILLIDDQKIEQAISQFEAALRVAPGNVDASERLMKAYALANRSADSLAIGRQALELARAASQEAQAAAIEDWLAHYQKELQRSGEN